MSTPPPPRETPAEAPAQEETREFRTPWTVHLLGALLGCGFVWLMAPDPPPKRRSPQELAAIAAAKVPAKQGAEEQKSKRVRASPRVAASSQAEIYAQGNPVAVDSGFRPDLSGALIAESNELRTMYLSRPLLSADAGAEGGLQFNRGTHTTSIKAGAAQFDFGVAMFPPKTGAASATFRIPSGARSFHATLAIANGDGLRGRECNTQGGSVTFLIKTDSEEAYRRIIVGTDGPHANVEINLIAATKNLTLVTDSADGDNNCDAAVWALARFMVDPPKSPTKRVGDGVNAPPANDAAAATGEEQTPAAAPGATAPASVSVPVAPVAPVQNVAPPAPQPPPPQPTIRGRAPA